MYKEKYKKPGIYILSNVHTKTYTRSNVHIKTYTQSAKSSKNIYTQNIYKEHTHRLINRKNIDGVRYAYGLTHIQKHIYGLFYRKMTYIQGTYTGDIYKEHTYYIYKKIYTKNIHKDIDTKDIYKRQKTYIRSDVIRKRHIYRIYIRDVHKNIHTREIYKGQETYTQVKAFQTKTITT